MKRRHIIFTLLIAVVAFIAYQFAPPPEVPPFPDGYHADRAVWMGVTWPKDSHTDSEIATLAHDLQARRIGYVFVYVSYLKPGDFFNPTYDHAAGFTERLRSAAPEITLLAWIGVPISVTVSGGQNIPNRLNDPAARDLIAEFSARMVTEFGFDGVHLNAELIPDGDEAFIATLQTIRAQLPGDAMLSTTAHALRLTHPVTAIPYPTSSHHWSANYLREVAENSDQVVLMAYDSGLFFPSDYRSWIAYQIRISAEALADVDTHFLIGIPVSEEWTPSHQVNAESLANAIYGLRVGLSESRVPDVINGVAVYPYWEADVDEWMQIAELP